MGWAPCPSPCSGSMANCMTLVRMVMAPTARSPPYFSSEVLKHTEITLSLACMTNRALPSARQGRMTLACRRRLHRRIRIKVFLPSKKDSTHRQDSPWDSTVASAAPCTPMWKPKINSGSSAVLATAPMSTESIPTLAKPCAVIKAFMPRVSCTNTVPRA